jgi:hypothetical protein
MTTNNPQAQTEQTQTKPIIDLLEHRLYIKGDDITNDLDFINTFDMMTTRATGILEVMADYMTKTSGSSDKWINHDAMYYSLQSAINEIKDASAVVNAYVKSKRQA